MKEGAERGIKLKIFYFSLEMSKEEKIKQLISFFLYIKKGLLLSPTKLESKFENYILEDEVVNFLAEEKEFFQAFEDIVEFKDEVRNPYGIYKTVREYAYNHGTYYDRYNNKLSLADIKDPNNAKVNFAIDHYEPDDPDEYVIVLIDHVSLISPEKGKNKHESMTKLSSDYLLRMRDRWKYSPVLVQQQAADSEKQQFSMSGQSMINKLKPSPDGLGDNKLIGRDCNYMLGLFSPNRYDFKSYGGYDLTRLKDTHRDLSIIFSRHSSGSQSVGLLFLGAVNYFKELPKEMTDEHYEIIKELQEKMKG